MRVYGVDLAINSFFHKEHNLGNNEYTPKQKRIKTLVNFLARDPQKVLPKRLK